MKRPIVWIIAAVAISVSVQQAVHAYRINHLAFDDTLTLAKEKADDPGLDARDYANAVLVGTVDRVSVELRGIPAVRDPKRLLDLKRVDIHIENLLFNDHMDSTLEFYTFESAGRDEFAKPGRRYIFYLRESSNGIWRSAGDGNLYRLPLGSGSHKNTRLGYGLDQAIADVMLTLGTGMDLPLFLRNIDEVGEASYARAYQVKLLRKLLTQPEPIRSKACLVLVKQFRGQNDCLESLPRNPEIDTLRNQQAEWDRDALKRLCNPMIHDFPVLGDLDHFSRIKDELLAYSQSPHPQIQQAACAAFRYQFPKDGTTVCGMGRSPVQ